MYFVLFYIEAEYLIFRSLEFSLFIYMYMPCTMELVGHTRTEYSQLTLRV